MLVCGPREVEVESGDLDSWISCSDEESEVLVCWCSERLGYLGRFIYPSLGRDSDSWSMMSRYSPYPQAPP